MSASERNKDPELHEDMKRPQARPNSFISLHVGADRMTSPHIPIPPLDKIASGCESDSSPIGFLAPSLPGNFTSYRGPQVQNCSAEDALFSRVIASSPQPFCSLQANGHIKACNEAFLELLGYTPDEMRVKTGSDLVPSDLRDRESFLLAELRRKGEPQLRETEFLRKDGARVPVEASVHRIAHGSEVLCCWFLRNITDRKRVEGKLQDANRDLSNYVAELEQRNRETELFSEMISLLQACVSLDEVQSVVGRLVRELFARESGALYLLNPGRRMYEPVTVWGESKGGEQAITTKECWSLRLSKAHVTEAHLPGVRCSHVRQPLDSVSLCVPLVAQGETLGLLHLRFNQEWHTLAGDVRERQKRHKQQLAIAAAENIALSLANFKLRDKLYLQSIHDYVTGLYNRRYMAELLEKELHRMARKKQSAGVIIIDIDRFKSFNDNHGHEAGDTILCEFSQFLRKNIREEDFACRYGGDEFVVILPETPLENARLRAEQLRTGAKNLSIQFRGHTLDAVTLSLGVAVYPNHGSSSEALLRTADAALYRAKAEGRDRVASL